MGGETTLAIAGEVEEAGLSPRGRGNRTARPGQAPYRRSIPAWAGKPVAAIDVSMFWEVYPRVGGETVVLDGLPDDLKGLSPRGRGNPEQVHDIVASDGSIPAWAGKPFRGAFC